MFCHILVHGTLGCQLSCGSRTLGAGYGSHDGLIIGVFAKEALRSNRVLGVFIYLDVTGGDGDEYTVLRDSNQFSWSSVFSQSSVALVEVNRR